MTISAGNVAFHQQPLHEQIRRRLILAGVRQVDVATALGIGQPQVSNRLNGRTPIRLDELAIIADLLHTTPAELLAGDA